MHQRSCVETPQQNAIVERKHQHILNVGRAISFQSKLPNCYWSYDVLHAVFLINRVTTSLLHHKSPYHVLYDHIPDSQSFKVFGCLCFASTLQSHITKLHYRARKSVFLGYKSGYKGYILLDLHTRAVFISRNVIFHENVLPYQNSTPSVTANWNYLTPSPPSFADIPDNNSSSRSPNNIPPQPTPITTSNLPTRTSSRTKNTPAYLKYYICPASHNIHLSYSKYPISDYLSYANLSYAHSCFNLSLQTHHEPKTLTEANKHDCWKKAMQDELNALDKTSTWIVVDLPPNAKPIGYKWI